MCTNLDSLGKHYSLDPQTVIDQSHGRRPEDTARSILGDNADIKAAVDFSPLKNLKKAMSLRLLEQKS
ncbi:hypothetical protein [Xenorhabdus sp. TH1]|uniref:hypothetical protein n=1 Tax=Xenorhabdus sp. TH1 TaxID=3130166 RepID=UPI0030CACE57